MRRAFLVILFSLITAALSVAVEQPGEAEVPSAVVRAYLQALLDGRYDQTYNYLSSKRQSGMSREDWVEQLKRHAAKPRSKVLFMRVNPAIVRGEQATVVTSFRLKTPEGRKVSRETYSLIREQGRWRIDGIKVFDAPTEK
ncbi:MAG: hypothetical protein ACE5I9_05475 [Candidatus Methylomirabilales bacterium]